jgi:hypothetical protein
MCNHTATGIPPTFYSAPAGIEDHWRLSQESWIDFGAMVEMLASCETQTLHCGSIAQSLW